LDPSLYGRCPAWAPRGEVKALGGGGDRGSGDTSSEILYIEALFSS
jgi:hypothetical protein